MNLYTISISFEDRTVGVDQVEANSPEQAVQIFVKKAECLDGYNRDNILFIIDRSIEEKKLLVHIANNFKGYWMINFGGDFMDDPQLSSIYDGTVVQTDPNGPVRK